MNKISVICPAYNAEDNLSRCISSILANECVGELFVINDGSQDNTLKIARSFVQRDSRVHVIDKHNEGVSIARNLGLSLVTCPYVIFVDADDLLQKESLSDMLRVASANECDMTYGDYEVIYPDQRRHFPNEFAHLGSGALESKSVLASLMEIDDASVSGSVWRILFKTDFIKNNNLLFPEHICMSEDYYFIMKCLERNPKIYHFNSTVYLFQKNYSSATHKYMPSLEHDMDYVNNEMLIACGKDPSLLAKYYRAVANTCWFVCRNEWKSANRGNLDFCRRKLSKYAPCILRAKNRMSCKEFGKLTILKISIFIPYVLKTLLNVCY